MVLGKTGRNFAAGMSGGIAYIHDADGTFKKRCNLSMVELEPLATSDAETVNNLLVNHYRYTASPAAKKVLDDFKKAAKRFVKVMPIEYKRVLEEKKVEKKLELSEVSDG